jgi:hypothetical protein
MTPFLPTIVSGSGDSSSDTSLSADGHLLWQRTPSACDLAFYQGDDIVIPLYFNDPQIANDDMAMNFEWFAQIRVFHNYRSTLVNDFVCKASFHTGTTEEDEYTVVELFLPRSENIHRGCFNWELYSISTEDYSRFPKPDDVDAADWPPPDALRTWLWGHCTIVPRTSTTDALPVGQLPSDGVTPIITYGGWTSGPNGKVP